MTKQAYIYTLRETGDTRVCYVGQTIDPKARLTAHIGAGDADSSNAKNSWIGRVLAAGGRIEMDVIDMCQRGEASVCEAFWIDHYKSRGCLLVNAIRPPERQMYSFPEISPESRRLPARDWDDWDLFSDEEWEEIDQKMQRITRMLLLIAEKLGIDTSEFEFSHEVAGRQPCTGH